MYSDSWRELPKRWERTVVNGSPPSICRPRLAVPGHSAQTMLPRSPLLLFILSAVISSLLFKIWLDSVNIINIPSDITEVFTRKNLSISLFRDCYLPVMDTPKYGPFPLT